MFVRFLSPHNRLMDELFYIVNKECRVMTRKTIDMQCLLSSDELDEQAFVFMIMGRKPDQASFSGTLKECLGHLYQAMLHEEVHHPEFLEQVIEELIIFTGVRRQTILRWMELEQVPKGENLIRLQFYLLHHGYDICELRLLPKFWIRFVMYVILGNITWDRVAKAMNLKSSQLFTILSGSKPMTQFMRFSMVHLLISAHHRETASILEEVNITMIDGAWDEDELDDCKRFLPQETRRIIHPPHRLLRKKAGKKKSL